MYQQFRQQFFNVFLKSRLKLSLNFDLIFFQIAAIENVFLVFALFFPSTRKLFVLEVSCVSSNLVPAKGILKCKYLLKILLFSPFPLCYSYSKNFNQYYNGCILIFRILHYCQNIQICAATID